MPDQPPRCRVKIERAKHHIADLVERFQAYAAPRPYRAIFDGDSLENWKPPGGWTFQPFVVTQLTDFDLTWGVIVGEVANNCRTCLDNAWNEIAAQTPRWGRGAGPGHDEFPFYSQNYKSRFKGKEHGTVQVAVNYLRSIKADQAGHPLEMLALLDNLNKHEVHIFTAARMEDFGLPFGDTTHPIKWLSDLEEGTILEMPLPPGQVKMEYNLPFAITFAEAKVTKQEPVIPTLENLTRVTESVIDTFLALGIVS